VVAGQTGTVQLARNAMERASRQGPSTGFGDNYVMASREHTVWTWVAVAATAGGVAWVLYGFMPERSDPSHTGAASAPVNLRGDAPEQVAAGATPSPPAAVPAVAVDRFKLVGVMVTGRERIVLISVDGKPARMFRVGETVDGDTVVRDVSARGATLGPRDGGAAVALELSQAAPPATVAAPVPAVQAVPRAPLADGSVQSQEILRKIGAKYAPLPPQTASAPQKPVDGAVAPVDDGRWKPPGQQ